MTRTKLTELSVWEVQVGPDRDDEGEIQTWQIRLEEDDDAPGLAPMISARLFP
ncbi:MAG: hypothetical protein O7H41_05325 [Planctomycetota bacterium]|nr:hypothetical protein [Planctomycetota bacterium]